MVEPGECQVRSDSEQKVAIACPGSVYYPKLDSDFPQGMPEECFYGVSEEEGIIFGCADGSTVTVPSLD